MMQRLAIKAHNLEVEGSNPSPATKPMKRENLYGGSRTKWRPLNDASVGKYLFKIKEVAIIG